MQWDIHHGARECVAPCINFLPSEFETLRQVMPELLELLDCCGYLVCMYFEHFLMLAFSKNNVISAGVVNVTQMIQRFQIMLVQLTEFVG
jgi:hypothetical protein